MSNEEIRQQLMRDRAITWDEANQILKERRKAAKQRRKEREASPTYQRQPLYAPGVQINYGNDLY